MEEEISKLCKSLTTFCDHLQNTSSALKQSVDHRPVPLDSASTTFKQWLIRRVTGVSSDLNMLESMSFGTVSLEELLGHCNEVYKKNQNDVVYLQELLQCSTNYIPHDEHEEELLDDSPSKTYKRGIPSSSKIGDDDLLLDDSLSLKSFGLSDACLATIASEANNYSKMEVPYQSATNRSEKGNSRDDLTTFEEPKPMLKVSKYDYETLPSFMKTLASWEDLLAAVEKVNLYLGTKGSQSDSFRQDETSSLELGHKTRSYLMLLIKLNGLVIETTDGLIHYKYLMLYCATFPSNTPLISGNLQNLQAISFFCNLFSMYINLI
ncbi:hypothetical protein Leryth_012211 [Lithospermum erythrorhizon]|nr:hypothetical protein Leryth_012211 [Lithospermum erythrorhizon]